MSTHVLINVGLSVVELELIERVLLSQIIDITLDIESSLGQTGSGAIMEDTCNALAEAREIVSVLQVITKARYKAE